MFLHIWAILVIRTIIWATRMVSPMTLASARYETQIRTSRDTVSIRRFRYARNHREGCNTQFDTHSIRIMFGSIRNYWKTDMKKSSIRIMSAFDTHSIRKQVFHKRLQSVSIALYFAIVWATKGTNIWVSGSPINWISECVGHSLDLICGKFGSCSIRCQYAADTLSRHSTQWFQEQWARNKRIIYM